MGWLKDNWSWKTGFGKALGLEDSKEGGIEKTSTLSPEQEELMKKMYGFTKGKIGEGLPAWEGDWTVPMGEEEEWGLGKYRESVEGMAPEETHDWYMEYIAPSEKRYMKEEIIPGIKESMVPGGNLRSTGTEREIGKAWEGFGEGQLGRIGEAIMGERAGGRQMLPGYMKAASLPRMIEQEELNREISEFVRTTPELSPILNLVMQIIGTQTQAAFYRPREPSMLEQMLPSIGTAIGTKMGGG